MFPHLTRFNLKNWIDENRGDWGRRRVIWEDSDFIIFVTRGPNDRTDFHINPGDEVFYQLEGELNLHYLTPDHKPEVAVLKEGEMFLLPALVPHSPRRGSWTLVVERVRRPDETDRFEWVCGNCTHTLYEDHRAVQRPRGRGAAGLRGHGRGRVPAPLHPMRPDRSSGPERRTGFVWKG